MNIIISFMYFEFIDFTIRSYDIYNGTKGNIYTQCAYNNCKYK